MPDPQTPAKGLTQPQVGGDNNEWGYLLNTDLALIDSALGGTLALSVSGNTTLNNTQVENTGYKFTGTLSAEATITWPAFFGFAMIENNTTGGFSIWSDGTNFTKTTTVGYGHGTTGTGEVVLADAPTITSPTFSGTVAGAGT